MVKGSVQRDRVQMQKLLQHKPAMNAFIASEGGRATLAATVNYMKASGIKVPGKTYMTTLAMMGFEVKHQNGSLFVMPKQSKQPAVPSEPKQPAEPSVPKQPAVPSVPAAKPKLTPAERFKALRQIYGRGP